MISFPTPRVESGFEDDEKTLSVSLFASAIDATEV
jgi:hypothetical protein